MTLKEKISLDSTGLLVKEVEELCWGKNLVSGECSAHHFIEPRGLGNGNAS